MGNNKITGHDYQLQWSDFLAKPPSNPGNRVAFTVANFSVSFKIRTGEEAMGLTVPRTGTQLGFAPDDVQIKVFPVRNRMWSVASAQTPALLAHEQGHYNIVGLIMAELLTDLLSPPNLITNANDWFSQAPVFANNADDLFDPKNRFKTAAAAQKWANSLLKSAGDLIKKLESNGVRDGVYDTQTNHGLNALVQGNWNRAFFLASPAGSGMRFAMAFKAMGVQF